MAFSHVDFKYAAVLLIQLLRSIYKKCSIFTLFEGKLLIKSIKEKFELDMGDRFPLGPEDGDMYAQVIRIEYVSLNVDLFEDHKNHLFTLL